MRVGLLIALAPIFGGIAAASPCRALINFTAADATEGQYQTVEVGADGSARQWAGLAVGAGDSLTQLRLIPHVRSQPGYVQRVDRLMSRTGKSWSGDLPSMEGGPEQGSPEWDELTWRDVTAVLGPYVSVNSRMTGYLGGAHGIDEPSATVRKDGAGVDLKTLLGADAHSALQAAVKQEGRRRGGWDNAPGTVDLKSAALRIHPGQLLVEKSVFCCTWAENHNQVEIVAPVPTPKALKPYVPNAQGWFAGAAGCPVAVRVHDGQIEWRNGKRQTVVASAPGRVLGVAWVTEKAPKLQAWPVDAALAKRLFNQSRTVKTNEGKLGLLEAALQADPGAPDVLAEMGWLAFKLGNHQRALAYTRRALEGVIESNADGRIRYNLGRILEATGAVDRARRAYRASLARRANATVQKRLQALEKKGER